MYTADLLISNQVVVQDFNLNFLDGSLAIMITDYYYYELMAHTHIEA